MAQHTPGPWVHHLYKDGNDTTVAALDGRHIADVYAITFLGNGDRAKAVTPTDQANARLIAAAPEMLEALRNLAKEMRHMLRVNPNKEGGLYRMRLVEAEAVISRAEGK